MKYIVQCTAVLASTLVSFCKNLITNDQYAIKSIKNRTEQSFSNAVFKRIFYLLILNAF